MAGTEAAEGQGEEQATVGQSQKQKNRIIDFIMYCMNKFFFYRMSRHSKNEVPVYFVHEFGRLE